jgi:hypothetical protein
MEKAILNIGDRMSSILRNHIIHGVAFRFDDQDHKKYFVSIAQELLN